MERQYQPHRINYKLPIIGLDLGCGFLRYREPDGFIGMDIIDYGQEIIWDVTKGIPLPDNSVPEVFTCHFLEHIEWEHIFEIFRELWRICINNAKIFIRVPHPDCKWAYQSSHMFVWDDLMAEHLFRALNAENNSINFNINFITKKDNELQIQAIVKKE